MGDSNDKTIQSYEAHVQEYIDGTPQQVDGGVKVWLDTATADLPQDARILELGSAFGRDAAYLQTQGYAVDCTDVTVGFVELLQQKGFTARKLNAITDPLPSGRDLVLANAVLLHFTRAETEVVLQKILAALGTGGRFAFTLKTGEGEEWSDAKLGAPRFFCYWTAPQIEELLCKVGFSRTQIVNSVSSRNAPWLHIIAYK